MRPASVFDPMLQHERTALAWERTAIATIVAGVFLTRRGADIHLALGAFGVAQVALGAGLLVWTGVHYEQLHAPLRRGDNPAHPRATRVLGVTTLLFTGLATLTAVASVAF